MIFYLPTYEECKEIVSKNDAFYSSLQEVDGYKIEMFNYRIARSEDFTSPLPGSKITAHELRGLTFVHDGENVQRYIMLHKFFNLNQTEKYQYSDLVNLKINRVDDKLDGSMIRFIRLPNGKILAKTKMGLDNQQCILAQNLYNKDLNLQKFVETTLEQGKAAIFELISLYNRIVVVYQKTELRLLQLRCEATGEYVDIHNDPFVKSCNILLVSKENPLPLSEYIEKAKTEKGIEGWVFTFCNGQLVKLKTEEYFSLHGILTENLTRENLIISMILDETIDDAISRLDVTDVRRTVAETLQKLVSNYLKTQTEEVLSLISKYSGDKKTWAMAYRNEELFSVAARLLSKTDNIAEGIEKGLIAKLKLETYHLSDARAWLATKGVSIQSLESIIQSE